MVASQAQICNLALRAIGAKSIVAITDDSEQARILNDVYELIRNEVLAAHPWNFAIKRDTLSEVDVTPEYDYDYTFALPVDCLRVIGMLDDAEFQIEGGYLLTNESTAKIKYIAKITTSTSFSPAFVTAFALRLAAEIAFPLTNSPQIGQTMFNQYLDRLKLAKSIDGQEGKIVVIEDNSWIDDRE